MQDIPKEMIEKYLERRKTDLASLQTAREQNNFDVILRIGHQLKGNGTTYGFPELTRIGAEMEKAAQAEDMHAATAWISAFENFLKEKLQVQEMTYARTLL